MRRPATGGFVANSVANLLVGAAALGYAVIVPAVVLRQFGPDQYGTWYLAFQVAAYVLLLDLGSQYIVSRDAAASSGGVTAARLATAAVALQCALTLIVLGTAAAWGTVTDQGDLGTFIVVLGVAAAGSLVASTVRAWFLGLERAHVPALWLIAARVAAMVGLGLALAGDYGLVMLTVAVALPQLAVHALLLVWARRAPSPWALPDRAAFARLVRSTAPLAVWTIAGILIVGVDIFVVRALDPSEVAHYAIALPLVAIPTGVVTAAMTAWMPRVARAQAEGLLGGRDRTLDATTLMVAVLSVGAIPFIALSDGIVSLWAGPGEWATPAAYLELLYLASCLRFVFLPWSILIVVRGDQRRITAAPVTEAVVNLVASVALGVWLGALGVALGTVVGALIALGLYLGWAVPRTAASGITSSTLLRAIGAAGPPLAAAAGLGVLSVGQAPTMWRSAAALGAIGIDGWWLLRRRTAMAPQVTPLSSP